MICMFAAETFEYSCFFKAEKLDYIFLLWIWKQKTQTLQRKSIDWFQSFSFAAVLLIFNFAAIQGKGKKMSLTSVCC